MLCLGAWLAAGIHCAGDLEDPGRFLTGGESPVDTSAIPPGGCVDTLSVEDHIFPAICAQASCHGSESAAAAGLDLGSGDVAARISGRPAALCGDKVLLVPGRPSVSYLAEKVSGVPSCGERMPRMQDPLSEAEQACIKLWIAELP